MRRFTLQLTAIAMALPLAHAQNVRWSPEFTMPGVRRKVLAVGTYDGKLVAGGTPIETRDEFLGHLAVFDGNRWRSLGDGVDDFVIAVQEFRGDLIVAGKFLTAGSSTALHIARWDGSLWHSMAGGIGNGLRVPTVFDLEIFQGELYAAGEFTTAGGSDALSIARWDGASWSPVGGGISRTSGAQGTVRVLHATSTHLYAGGNFERAGGQIVRHLARWDGATWSDFGGGTETFGTIASITTFQGDLYVGGTFNYMSGTGTFFNHIARWDGSTWQDVDGGLPDGASGVEVNSLRVFDDALYATGNILTAGGPFGSGILTPRVARWDGSSWSSTGGIWESDSNEQDWPTTVWDGKLIVGGRLSFAGPSSNFSSHVVSTGVIAYDGSEWSTVGTGLGIEGQTNVIVPWNGGWIVGGAFTNAGGQRYSNLVFWNGGRWSAVGEADRRIHDALVHAGELFVAGDFTEIDGVSVSGVARFDGASWSPVGDADAASTIEVYQDELYIGGSGTPRRFDGSSWVPFGPQLFGNVVDLHTHAGKLWIGGTIGEFAGPGPYLLSWDGATMEPVGAPNRRVTGLASFGADLIVGGEFDQIGGVDARGVARFDGSAFRTMGSGLGGGGVLTFEIVEGQLYAGGNFTPFFGAPPGFVARWTGSTWMSLGSGVGGAVTDLAYDPASRSLYVTGQAFQTAGDKPCRAFAAWRVGDDPFGSFCESSETSCPCTAPAESGGCPNGTGRGGQLAASGFASISAGALTLESTELPPRALSVLFAGPSVLLTPIPLQNGMRCVAAPRRVHPLRNSDERGTLVRENVIQELDAVLPGGLLPGSTWYFQDWHRDRFGACGLGANTSNGVAVQFSP